MFFKTLVFPTAIIMEYFSTLFLKLAFRLCLFEFCFYLVNHVPYDFTLLSYINDFHSGSTLRVGD